MNYSSKGHLSVCNQLWLGTRLLSYHLNLSRFLQQLRRWQSQFTNIKVLKYTILCCRSLSYQSNGKERGSHLHGGNVQIVGQNFFRDKYIAWLSYRQSKFDQV